MMQTNGPHPATGDSSSQYATTFWINNAVAVETAARTAAVSAEATRAEAAEATVTASISAEATRALAAEATVASNAATALSSGLAAALVSPTFTGTPTAPTAAPGTNTTQLASTAFVTAAVAARVLAPCTIAQLPAASSSSGLRGMVTNSSQAASGNFGATLSATTGTNIVPVWSIGTNWLIG